MANLCNWRIGLWETCSYDAHYYARSLFLSFTVIASLLLVACIVYLFLYWKWDLLKKFELDVQVLSLKVLACSLNLIHCVLSLPGNGFGLPVVILEFFFEIPWFMNVHGCLNIIVAWAKAIHQISANIPDIAKYDFSWIARAETIFRRVICPLGYSMSVVMALLLGFFPEYDNILFPLRNILWVLVWLGCVAGGGFYFGWHLHAVVKATSSNQSGSSRFASMQALSFRISFLSLLACVAGFSNGVLHFYFVFINHELHTSL